MADSTLSNLTSLTLPSQATDLLLVGRGTARPNKVAMSDALNSAALAATTSTYGVVQLAASGGTTAGTVVQATDARLSDTRNPPDGSKGDIVVSGSGSTWTIKTNPTLSGTVSADIVRVSGGLSARLATNNSGSNIFSILRADGTTPLLTATDASDGLTLKLGYTGLGNGSNWVSLTGNGGGPGANITLNNGVVASFGGIAYQVNGLSRWYLSRDPSQAESGSNAGSDFAIIGYTDAGAAIGTAFSIKRSNFLVQCAGALTAFGAINASFLNTPNGTTVGPFTTSIGADATLGALTVSLGGSPSATGASRFGYIGAGDAVSWRRFIIGSNNTSGGGPVLIPATDSSTNTSSGALVIGNGTSGGLGVGGSIFAGNNINSEDPQGKIQIRGTGNTTGVKELNFLRSDGGDACTIGLTGSAYAGVLAAGGLGNSEAFLYNPTPFRIFIGINATNRFDFTASQFKINPTTVSNSTSSGALVVSGGLGVAGAAFFGGNIQCNAVFAANNTTLYLRPQGATISAGQAQLSTTGDLTLSGTIVDPAITGTILEDIFTITDGAAFEVDPGNGSIQLITLGASRTPKATNFAAGESITLMVNDGTAYTLTWTDATWGTGGVAWVGGSAPTLATTGYTVIQFWKVGTQIYGARVGDVA